LIMLLHIKSRKQSVPILQVKCFARFI